MRAPRFSLLCLTLAFTAACSANPPPRWVEGGAVLVIPDASWDRADGDPVEIRADGAVLEDGELLFNVDRAGRVVDEDNEPVAILLPDGYLAGPDNQPLGRVGVSNAAPPDSGSAWLALMPNGDVVRFDVEGEQSHDGRWTGCEGPARRTCTLISHVMAVRHYRTRPRTSVGIGVGIGF